MFLLHVHAPTKSYRCSARVQSLVAVRAGSTLIMITPLISSFSNNSMHWPIFDHFRKPSGSVQYSSLLVDQATSQDAAEDTTPITLIGALEILSSLTSLDISTQLELSDYRTGSAFPTESSSSSQTSALSTTSTSHTSELQTSELQPDEFQNKEHQTYQFHTNDAQENLAHISETQMSGSQTSEYHSAPTSATSVPTSVPSGDSIIVPTSAPTSAPSGDSNIAPTNVPPGDSIRTSTSVTQSVPQSVPILTSETRTSETYLALQTYQSSTFLLSSSESSIPLPTSGYMHSIDSEPEVHHHEKLSKEGKIAVGVIVPLVLIALGIMLFILYFQRKKKEKEDSFWTSPTYYDFASPYMSQQEKLPTNFPPRDSPTSDTSPSNTPPSNTPISNTPPNNSSAHRNSVATAHSNF